MRSGGLDTAAVMPELRVPGLAHVAGTLEGAVTTEFNVAAIFRSAGKRMLTEAEVREALRDCYDPEVPCNIVDLGLVYRVDVARDEEAPGAGIPGVPAKHRVQIALTLTSPGCPAQEQISAQIQNRLAAFETVSRTEVEMVWEPKWTPHRISAEGRKRLGIE